VSLPLLPLHLFNYNALMRIGASLGSPMKIDHSTFSDIRPSVARLCIEMDLIGAFPERLWIGDDTLGFWQHVVYENVPFYCHQCFKLGHNKSSCLCKQSPSMPKKPMKSVKVTFHQAPMHVNKKDMSTAAVTVPAAPNGDQNMSTDVVTVPAAPNGDQNLHLKDSPTVKTNGNKYKRKVYSRKLKTKVVYIPKAVATPKLNTDPSPSFVSTTSMLSHPEVYATPTEDNRVTDHPVVNEQVENWMLIQDQAYAKDDCVILEQPKSTFKVDKEFLRNFAASALHALKYMNNPCREIIHHPELGKKNLSFDDLDIDSSRCNKDDTIHLREKSTVLANRILSKFPPSATTPVKQKPGRPKKDPARTKVVKPLAVF
jgi:hypothetical protein